MRRAFRRLLSLFTHRRDEAELSREMESHLAMLEASYQQRGMTPDEARLAARRTMGSVVLARELHREARAFTWIDDLLRDVRFAMRLLRRDSGFTAVAVVTLAAGIGVNTAIFSVINAVLVRPLPYDRSDRLVRITEYQVSANATAPVAPRIVINPLELEALRESRTLSDVGMYSGRPFSMTVVGNEGPTRLVGERVSPEGLSMLGVRPFLGRTFEPHEEQPGSDAVAVLGYGTWQRDFSGRSDILGHTVSFDGRGYSIVGVMPPGFEFPHPQAAFWIPFVPASRTDRDSGISIARIADDATTEAATAEVGAILAQVRVARVDGAVGAKPRVELTQIREELVGPIRRALFVLVTAVGLVLLIACTNVASLLLARTSVRDKEIAARIAIGAGCGRLLRQALTESVMLALAGGVAGSAVAVGLVQLLHAFGAGLPRNDLYTAGGVSIPRLDEVGVDASAFAFTLGVSVLTGVACGVVPALRQLRSDVSQTLRRGSGSSRMHSVLVVGQLAMAMMLLAGAGLLVHSFVRFASVRPGYEPDGVVWYQAFLPRERSAAQTMAFAEDLTAKLRSLPGVQTVGYAPQILTGNLLRQTSLRTTPAPPDRPPAVLTDVRVVSHDFLSVMGVRVLEGRGLRESDGAGHTRVMLINRALARSGMFSGSPIGQRFYAMGDQPWEIVGIVDDVHQFGLDRAPGQQIFLDFRQAPSSGVLNGLYFAIRTTGSPAALAVDVRRAARDFDPQAAVSMVATMEQLLSNTMSRRRLYAVLLGIFAAVAVALAVIGLFGMMSYAVAQRTREIAVRMALGAPRKTVLALVLRQSLVIAVAGIILGLAGAVGLTRYLSGMLFELTPLDPTTFVVVVAVFGAVATLASLVPARRATRIDPVVAMRSE
jgi:putative ABC transport system permease protein